MRRLLIALAVLMAPASTLAASTNIADLPAGHYRLDPKHASLIVKVKHLGTSWYVARFDRFDADFTYDPTHPEATTLQASVDATSFDVGADYSRKFANDFIAAAGFPQATFHGDGDEVPPPTGAPGP